MRVHKNKNFSKEHSSNQNKKSNNKNNIDRLDNPMKIYEYHNRVYMLQRKINKRVNEEKKYFEKNIKKFNTNFKSFTSRNFYHDYKKFSEKYFKTTNLVDDIAYKYHEKGYKIPKINNDLFKINPLLDCNMNKLFISYLFNGNGKKVDYGEFYRTNKSVKYIKKLLHVISPEENEDEKEKVIINKLRKKKVKSKNVKTDKKESKENEISKRRLMHFMNVSEHKMDNGENNKSYSSNKIIKIYHDNDISTERYSNKSKYSLFNAKNKLNRSKTINNNNLPKFKERKKNRNESHRTNLKEKSGLNTNSTAERNKARNSSINLASLNVNLYTSNNNQNLSEVEHYSSKVNHHFFLNIKKINEESEKNINTPKNKDKIEISSRDKSTNNTKPFSSTTNEENYSTNTKKSIKSFKINEFSNNSKTTKNSTSSKKLIITDYNNRNLPHQNFYRYSFTGMNKKNENSKIEDIFKDAMILTKSNNKLNFSQKKEGVINLIYKQLKAGRYGNIENQMKNYLSKTKKFDDDEINFVLKKYNYKNLKSNFSELKQIIKEKKISKKIERIYLNNNDYNRIESLMNSMNKKDKEIFRFENTISKIYNHS